MQCRLVGNQQRQLFVERLDGICRVETKGLFGALGPVTETIPGFAFHVLVTTEQDLLRLVAGNEDKHGLGFGKAGQVMKVAVGTVGVVCVAVAILFSRSRNDRNAATHEFDQSLAALLERRDIHG